MFAVAGWFSGLVRQDNTAVNNDIMALGYFSGVVALWCSDLNYDLANVIHAIDTRGYSMDLFQRSLNDCVEAWRNIISA